MRSLSLTRALSTGGSRSRGPFCCSREQQVPAQPQGSLCIPLQAAGSVPRCKGSLWFLEVVLEQLFVAVSIWGQRQQSPCPGQHPHLHWQLLLEPGHQQGQVFHKIQVCWRPPFLPGEILTRNPNKVREAVRKNSWRLHS